MSKLIDIHCHLSDTYYDLEREELEANSNILNVSTALSIEEVHWHLEKKIKYWFAGLHPREWNVKTEVLDDFYKKISLNKVLGIGEIGLDKRYKNLDKQNILLKRQMNIAKRFFLPTLYHLVGCEYDFIKIHKEINLQNMKIIHGFNSSYEVYKELDKLGFYFSLSQRLLTKQKRESTICDIIKSQKFFLESDAPDGGSFNEVIGLAKILETNYNINRDKTWRIVGQNFDRLIKETCEAKSKIKFNN